MFRAIEHDYSFTVFDSDESIVFGMYLYTDVIARPQSHEHQLGLGPVKSIRR